MVSPWALVSLLSLIALSGLCVYVYRRPPPQPLWPSLFFALLSMLVFNVGNFLLFLTSDPFWAWVYLAITYTGLIFIVPMNFIVVHRFAESLGKGFSWGNSKWLWAPIPIAVLVWLFMLSNPWHELFLLPRVNQRSEFKIGWLVHTGFAYALSTSVLVLYFVLLRRVNSAQQRTRVLVMTASMFGFFGNALFFIPAFRVPFDPTTLGFAIGGAFYLLGIYPTKAYPIRPFVLTSILRRQSVGLVLTDSKGHISFWNDAASKAIDEPLGQIDEPFSGWLNRHTEYVEGVDDNENALDQSTIDFTPKPSNQILKLKKRSKRWIRVAVYPIADRKEEQVDSLMYQIEDCTNQHLDEIERNKIQLELEDYQRQEDLALLAGGIAHDFNNILAAIQGNVELSQEDLTPDSPILRRLETIADATQRGARLTQQLLSYAGKSTPQPSHLELQPLVDGVTELLSTYTKSRGQYLHTTAIQPNVVVYADQGQLEQVIMNLALNAVEASTHGDSIYLSAGVCDQFGNSAVDASNDQLTYAFISIRDEGSGMDEETRNRIFDPFYTTKKQGRGLGLSAVRGIVNSHGGTMEVESTLGEGTEFKIVFPRHESATQDLEEDSTRVTQGSLRALVVDDEQVVGEICCQMLKAIGCSSVFADSGAQALSIMRNQSSSIDLIILDIAMPHIDGISLFQKLRKMVPGLPVIFVSGHPSNVLPSNIAESSSVGFLNKPYKRQQLVRALNAITE